ncbi:glycosyltransferase [Candidatus Roizmanbacteria bacterium]|nr:glycosyltransferase [Candidatus Roizmanbacteria bacterium]
MKKRTAALYDPYLDVMGGGEKHILSILQVLEKDGYEVSLFWDQNLSSQIKNKLNLQFSNLSFVPDIFKTQSPIEKVKTLKDYDVFFYVTDGSYFFSGAKKNVIFCMVPNPALYKMGLMNKLKTYGNQFVANSSYTQKLLQKWGIKSDIIYPYVTEDLLQTKPEIVKEKIILSVGRFFGHLHTKKHEDIIKTFLTFQKTHGDFKLILIGGLKDEDKTYFESLVKLVGDNKNIVLKPNAPYQELLEYYRKSMFFWHFAGYGVDEEKHPEMVEHLGMTPLEAMAAGTVSFCYEAGGPKEIITDGENGYLFKNSEELLSKTEKILKDNSEYKEVQQRGQEYVKKYFSFAVFQKKVKEVLL